MLVSIILAAGLGKRMQSDLPKVLHEIHNKPLLRWVLEAAEAAGIREHVVVVGHGRELVEAQFAAENLQFAIQSDQLGTGHAVRMTQPILGKEHGMALILCGDTPCLNPVTLTQFLKEAMEYDVCVLSSDAPNPSGYGRILRDGYGIFTAIREDRDCSDKELLTKEINTGIYAVRLPLLYQLLSELSCYNSQGEYYLTDIVEVGIRKKLQVEAFKMGRFEEFLGVNTKEQLMEAASVLGGLRL